MSQQFQIMDVTIREGSYPIDFQFTASQVADIVAAIDQAGIPWIEVGNGIGLGFFESTGDRKPQATDIEQIRAAKKRAKKAKIGVIGLPEPFTKQQYIEAVREEVDFIRLAAPIQDLEAIKKHVSFAKSNKMTVFLQMMQSSKLPLPKIIEAGKKAQDFGPDAVYLVDTNGWFLPEDVTTLIRKLKETLSIKVGFHAHNNLMLAVANSLAAIEAGADWVDGSLLGFGRDAGNTQMEALVTVLQRKGWAKEIDLNQLIKTAEQCIQPIMPRQQGVPAYQVALANHNISLYPLPLYQQIAHAAEIDFLDLIQQIGKQRSVKPDIKKALTDLGKDAETIYKKLGVS